MSCSTHLLYFLRLWKSTKLKRSKFLHMQVLLNAFIVSVFHAQLHAKQYLSFDHKFVHFKIILSVVKWKNCFKFRFWHLILTCENIFPQHSCEIFSSSLCISALLHCLSVLVCGSRGNWVNYRLNREKIWKICDYQL